MKILFISNALGPDYLNDTVFHGGKTLLGHDLYESKRLWYMYDDLINKGLGMVGGTRDVGGQLKTKPSIPPSSQSTITTRTSPSTTTTTTSPPTGKQIQNCVEMVISRNPYTTKTVCN